MFRWVRTRFFSRMAPSDACALALLVLGTLRILAMVLHRPIYGYANNFDFYRLAQWYGIGEDALHPLPAHPTSPLREYVLGGPRELGNAYVSTEALILAVSVFASRVAAQVLGTDPSLFDIRWIGSVRAALLVAASVFATAAFRRQSGLAAVAVATCFAFVLADPISTLFLNGLYADYSVVLFGFASIAMLAFMNGTGRWSASAVTLAGLSLVALGLSKPQYQALPLGLVVLAAMFWLCEGRLTRRAALSVGMLASASLVALAIQNRKPSPGLSEAIRMANATDTWFGAVLPALRDPPRAVKNELGLPARCAAYVGRTWYDPGMQPPPCPEVAELSRASALALLLEQPAALRRFWIRGTEELRPPIVGGYGQVEDKPYGKVVEESNPLLSSFATLTDWLPLPLFRSILVLVFAIAPAAMAIYVDASRRQPRKPARGAHFTTALLAATAAYAFGSSVLGDGFVSLQHHALLCSLALWPALVFAVSALAMGLGRRRKPAHAVKATPA
jgi:hypothetical protein